MEIFVLNSGSSGNCYMLTSNSGERLILDLGCPWKDIRKMLNFNYERVAAVVTHRHISDHAKSVPDALSAGIPVYGGEDILKCFHEYHHSFVKCEDSNTFIHYGFYVIPFKLFHDVPINGFLIDHKECGTICFITDTKEVPYSFEGVNHWLIEANYCEDIILNNILTATTEEQARNRTIVSERVVKSHFSYQECEKFLLEQDLSTCENIVLLHLSDRNSHEEDFKRRMIRATGKTVYVADKGLTINLDI